MLKRLISFFLCLAIVFSMVPVQAFATGDSGNAEASMDSQEVDFEGTNAVGTLLAEAIAEEQQSTIVTSEDTPYEDGYTLTEIVVQGSTATVTYDALEEAQLVVALYSDDGMQLINTAKTMVTPEETTATVTFNGEMPQYFVVAAYLLDVYDYSPLCPSYETPMYTQDMQELLAMTVEDCAEEYGEERIYNLDNNNATNFGVYADGVVLLYEETGVNTVTSVDDVKLVYTFANADERVTSLASGSVVVYEYTDGELLLMKVSSITAEGTNVTIQGLDLEIEEVFAIMKVEADADTEDTTFDPTGLEGNIEYLGTDAPQTYDYSGSIGDKLEHTFYFWGEKDENKDEEEVWDKAPEPGITGKGKFEGTLSLGIEAELKFYISLKRQFLEFKVSPNVTFKAELSGYINFQSSQLGKGFDIYLCPGVCATLRPTFNLKFSGKIEFEAKLFCALGGSVEHRAGGNWQFQNLCTKPKVESELEFEGKIFIGFDFHPGVKVISDKVCKAELTDELGFELTAKQVYKAQDYNATQLHDCNVCLDGNVSAVWQMKLKLKFLDCEKLEVEHTFHKDKISLFDFYFSVDNKQFGRGDCPNQRYRIYIKVEDKDGNLVEGAEVYYINPKEDDGKTTIGITNANGVVMDESILGNPRNVFLSAGSYALETVIKGEIIRNPDPVDVYTYTSVVLTSNPKYWEQQEKLKLLMIKPDNVSAGSILDSGKCGNKLNWRFYSSGLIEIYGEGPMDNYASASQAPWYQHKDKITSLRIGENNVPSANSDTFKFISVGKNAFNGYTTLRKVILEDNVTSVGQSTFSGCSGLKEIKMPVDITFQHSSNTDSFADVVNVTNIHYTFGKSGQMSKRHNEFYNRIYTGTLESNSRNSLTGVYLDEGITSITAFAFYECNSLVSIAIPTTVSSIEERAFLGCSKLSTMNIPSKLTYLGHATFSGCTSLTSIIIPTGITYIPQECFFGCSGLRELIIPDNIRYLQDSAFAECIGLTSVTLPADLNLNFKKDTDAFAGVSNVQSIRYTPGKTGIMYGRSAYNDNRYSSLEYNSRSVLQSVTMYEGVQSIGDGVFCKCTALNSISIPSTVTSIGVSAFQDCRELSTVALPEKLTFLGDYAFKGCTNIKDIKIPSGITEIPRYCFQGCTDLTELVIPDNVRTLCSYAFADCIALSKVTMPVDISCKEAFSGVFNVTNIHYTPGKTGVMGTRAVSSSDHNKGYLEYYSRDTLKSITFGEGVLSIGNSAFYHCTSLISIILPSTLNSIGSYAFYYCTKLNNISFPAGLTKLGELSFYSCFSLKTLNLPDGITEIPKYCFRYCTGLEELIIPDTVRDLGVSAFGYCNGLNEITMPIDFPTQDGYSTSFDGITNVINIHYTRGETGIMSKRWASNGILNAHSLEYYSQNTLQSVTFGEGILSIADGAFYKCSNLRDVLFLGNSPTIASSSFSGVAADALYPYGNDTWTESAMQNYGGTLSWIPYILDEDGSILTDFTTDPVDADPEETEPEETGHEVTEPDVSEPEVIEPEATELEATEPEATDSEVTEPEATEPEMTESEKIEPEITDPEETVPGVTEPEINEPQETVSVVTEPEEIVPEALSELVPSSASAEPEKDILNQGTVGSGDIQVSFPAANAVYGGMNEAEFEDKTGAVIQSTTFHGLVAGSEYVMFALVSMEVSDLLASSNILYIGQAPADNNGSLNFRYIQKAPTDNFNVFACGASHRHLRNASITFPKMEDNGELRIAEPTVTYGGEILVEGVDYVVLDGQGAQEAGDYLCTIRGICNYTGLITCSYTVDQAVNTITMATEDLDRQNSVWIDGIEYAVKKNGEKSYVELRGSDARIMISYTYSSDPNYSDHMQYPTGMKVWTLENKDGIYTATRQEAFDDILQYSGMSIRVTGKKGIRMITSIEKNKKNALVSGGLAGFTLKEYGTVVAWASELASGSPLVLGESYVKSNYAYKKGVADPVFQYTGNLMQYTNVLVNFSNEQCKNDIALRPYMILEDKNGDELIIYGGIVYRSIGYIAYQNRNVFEPQTEEYNYIWDIIHYVYGDVYDDDFVHAWTPSVK